MDFPSREMVIENGVSFTDREKLTEPARGIADQLDADFETGAIESVMLVGDIASTSGLGAVEIIRFLKELQRDQAHGWEITIQEGSRTLLDTKITFR